LHRLLRYCPLEELFDLLIHWLSSFHGGGDDSGASSSPVTLSSSSVSPSPSLNGGDSGSSPGESSGCTWSHYSSSFDEDALLASPLLYIPECAHDPLGRTPLHIAAAVGCHVPIIHRLLDGATCASPAFVTDDKGRCPLHWACENPNGSERVVLPNSKRDSLLSSSMIMCKSTSRRFVSRAATSSSATGTAAAAANLENMMGVIRALLNAYPEAVNIPDKDGMTPVDLACKANACPMLIQMLEETAKLYPKNRWTTWEEAEDVMTTSHWMQLHVITTRTEHDDGGGGGYDSEDDISSLGWDGDFQTDYWNNHHACGTDFASERISIWKAALAYSSILSHL